MLPLLSLLLAPLARGFSYTPTDMLSAPRPHAPILHPSGDAALHAVDVWDATSDTTERTISIIHLPSGKAEEILRAPPAHASEVFWLDKEWAYLNGSDVYVGGKGDGKGKGSGKVHSFPEGVDAGSVRYQDGKLFFVGQLWAGYAFNQTQERDEKYAKRGDGGVVFDELFIRHWDTWVTPGKIWTVGSVDLSTGEHKDMMDWKPNGRRPRFDTPSYTLSPSRLAITYKTPYLNPATHTRTSVSIVDLDGTLRMDAPLVPGLNGAQSSAAFDASGSKLAWLVQAEDGYESDQNRLAVWFGADQALSLDGAGEEERVQVHSQGPLGELNPQSVIWSRDNQSLYLTAEDKGRTALFKLSHGTVTRIPVNGSVIDVQDTPHGLLITASSLAHPARVYLNDRPLTNTPALPIEPEEFWFDGVDRKVMAWVIRPSPSLTKGRPAPLAFLIHGGPQGAWLDSWSTRWNPALYALQGYFVVAVNPTGSTGYGQAFTDAIKHEWGGKPYKDLVAGYHAVLSAFSTSIDPARTAALGASYGGYMVNWLQGHNPGFAAFVCHDGIFDTTTSFYTTEEVYFPAREFGDPTDPDARARYEKWNPMNHVAEWNTPELVIHGGRDYRLVASQGFAAFTALQVRGVPSRLLYFEEENHWVLKPSNSVRWHREVFRWLDEWVGRKEEQGELVLQV